MTFAKNQLLFIPLGGSGEIGMNLNLYHYKGDWLMIDCGITFADERTPGVEILMPDIRFIEQIRDKLVGLVLTHAHEDHLGAVQYLWPAIGCPVYATPFTKAVLHRKLQRANMQGDVPIHTLPMSGTVKLGAFDLQLITLTHSIPEPNAVVIRTKAGTILHTGDWKIDPAPQVGDATDIKALQALADEGVLAMICDSTNVFTTGEAGSEETVAMNLQRLIAEQQGQVAVACFATNVARVSSIIKAAKACERAVVLAGTSLWRITDAAQEAGYLHDAPDFLSPEDALDLPARHVLYICTGSQGEPRSALARVANNDHPHLRLGEGDTVIFSSRIIPGNERSIYDMQNKLSQQGVHLITSEDEDIHVSGHPGRGELKQMYDWVKPQIVIPVHGEMRHMREQALFAKECQIPSTLVIKNGDVVGFNNKKASIIGSVPVGRLALHGDRLVPAQGDVIKQVHKVIHNGAVFISMLWDNEAGEMDACQVSTLGLLDSDAEEEMQADFADAIEDAINAMPPRDKADAARREQAAKAAVRRLLKAETGRHPRLIVHQY